jgi:hypothetical protein
VVALTATHSSAALTLIAIYLTPKTEFGVKDKKITGAKIFNVFTPVILLFN